MSKHFEDRLKIVGTDVYGNVMFVSNLGQIITSNIPSEKVDYAQDSIYVTGRMLGGSHLMGTTFESWNDQVLTIEEAN